MPSYLITGCSNDRGLGLGYAKLLAAQEGHLIVITARKPSEAMAKLVEAHTGKVFAVKLDTTDEASIEAAVKEVEGKLPHGLDYLINNAGISGPEGFVNPLECSKQDLITTFTTNTVGTFLVTKAFIPLLKKGSKKTVVNISSGLGSTGNVLANFKGEGKYLFGAANALTYRQSKAALNMQGAVLANALKGDGFTVLSMDPGWVDTDMGGSGGMKPDWPSAEASCTKQLEVIHSLKPEDSGSFIDLTGERLSF